MKFKSKHEYLIEVTVKGIALSVAFFKYLATVLATFTTQAPDWSVVISASFYILITSIIDGISTLSSKEFSWTNGKKTPLWKMDFGLIILTILNLIISMAGAGYTLSNHTPTKGNAIFATIIVMIYFIKTIWNLVDLLAYYCVAAYAPKQETEEEIRKDKK